MTKLKHYLIKSYLITLGKSIPIIVLSLLFVLSIRSFKSDGKLNLQSLAQFSCMALLEVMPWLIILVFYVYLNMIQKNKEYLLIKKYLPEVCVWKSLTGVWCFCSLLSLLYIGFGSPSLKKNLKSDHSLSSLKVGQVHDYHGGKLWMTEEGLKWRYTDQQQVTKMNVAKIRKQSDQINLMEGEVLYHDMRNNLKLNYVEGEMWTSQPLKGNKYLSIVECLKTKKWGELGFRMNHVFLVFLGSFLIWILFEKLGKWSLSVFILVSLCCYLPLWNIVKETRAEVSLMLSFLPSFILFLLILVASLLKRGIVK